MRDFFNFEIVPIDANTEETRFLLRHKKRDDVRIEFKTPNLIDADIFPKIFDGILKRYSRKYHTKTRKAMTAPQKRYYEKLVEFHNMEGRPPSYEEQCVMLGVSSKGTPHYYAMKLVDSGWVWIDDAGMIIPFDIAEPDIEDTP